MPVYVCLFVCLLPGYYVVLFDAYLVSSVFVSIQCGEVNIHE